MEVPRLKSEVPQEPWVYDWETWTIKDGQIVSPDHEKPLTELRKGTPSNYETLWRIGDAIPDASPAFQQYLILRNEWDSLETIDNTDGKLIFVDMDAAWRFQQEMDTFRDAAPELQIY